MSDNTKYAGNPGKRSAYHRMEALPCYFMSPSIWVIVFLKYFWRKWIQTCHYCLGVQKNRQQKGVSPVLRGVSGASKFPLSRIPEHSLILHCITLILYSCLSAECWAFFPPSKLITLEKLRVKYSAKHTFLTILVNELQIVLWFRILCPTVSIHSEII